MIDRIFSVAPLPRRKINTRISYKIVKVVNGKYYSVYDSRTEYILEKHLARKTVGWHDGGYYSYPTVEGVEERFGNRTLFESRYFANPMTLVLIECEISGRTIDCNGKLVSTYLRPIREIKRFDHVPILQDQTNVYDAD
jgi:hypothetical protein